jgi:hypothetical protein
MIGKTSYYRTIGDVTRPSGNRPGIPGTGHLERIVFNAKTEELRRESMLNELKQRIREVRQGPDGLAVSVDRRRRRRPSAD